MKRGFPRHLKVTFLPSGISPNFTSILAKAKTSADALMELTNSEIRESLSLRGTALGINFIVECGSATVVGEVRDLNIGVSIAHLARTSDGERSC